MAKGYQTYSILNKEMIDVSLLTAGLRANGMVASPITQGMPGAHAPRPIQLPLRGVLVWIVAMVSVSRLSLMRDGLFILKLQVCAVAITQLVVLRHPWDAFLCTLYPADLIFDGCQESKPSTQSGNSRQFRPIHNTPEGSYANIADARFPQNRTPVLQSLRS
jgi:hypothetical protein